MPHAKSTIPLLTVAQALEAVLDGARPLGTEPVALDASLGRILAETIASDADMPPFDKSAMDGFAVAGTDDDGAYRVVAALPAGAPPFRRLEQGECVRIMTGAPVPQGTGRVVRFEYASESGGRMRITRAEEGRNICPQGEDIRQGADLLAPGRPITVPAVGILAATGHTRVQVYRRPRVAIIATGAEIVEPHVAPPPGSIRNSNAWQLAAHVRQCGGSPRYLGIAADTTEAIAAKLVQSFVESDVIVLSGGVSMGDFDLVPGVLAAHGVELCFQKLAVKPGHPTVFGRHNGHRVFGLPGNPVSTFVIFELLVRPLLDRLAGRTDQPPTVQGSLAGMVKGNPSQRTLFLPVAYDRAGRVTPVEYHGSAHLHAYCRANAVLRLDPGSPSLPEGTPVHVRPI
ncbi:MAG: gephyrin-like molybdotransferase Glp [Planctomycetota bacterium]